MTSNDPKYVTFGLPDFEEAPEKKGFFNKVISKFRVESAAKEKDPSLKKENLKNRQWRKPQCAVVNIQRDARGSSVMTESVCFQSASPSGEMTTDNSAASSFKRTSSTSRSSTAEFVGPELPSDRRYWMLDQSCPQCFECGSRFTAIRRKHHCRVCGRIFCHQCSNQFLEGHLIGLSGPQRACNYCAVTLRTQTGFNKPPKNVDNPSTLSVNQQTNDSIINNANLSESSNENAIVHRTESCSRGSSDLWSRISQTATISSVSGAKQLLSAVNLGRPPKANVEDSKFTISSTIETSSDVFPGFAITASPVLQCKRFTQPSHPPGLRSSWSVNTPQITATFLQPGSLKSDTDPELPGNFPICTMNKRCSLVGHACTDLNDKQLSALWERTVERCLNNVMEDDVLIESANRGGSGSFALSSIHRNSKELQVIVVKHNGRKICCASGLSLVYWLVSNVEEMDHCRRRAHSACQRFMDLTLLLDLNDPSRKTFHDDFTPYELRPVRSPVTLSPCNLERRLSWPSASLPTINNLDEPDWLREIEDFPTRNPIDVSSSPHRSLTVSDDESTTRRGSTAQRTVSREQASLSASVELGVKILFPRDRPTKSMTHAFEVGEDIRPNMDSMDSSPVPRHRRTGEPSNESEHTSAFRVGRAPLVSEGIPKHASKYSELTEPMRLAYDEHLWRLVLQDVRDSHLDDRWTTSLLSLARTVCQLVSFDLRSSGIRAPTTTVNENDLPEAGDSLTQKSKRWRTVYSAMDIRHYVHVKKLLDDSNSECEIFPGTMFTKRPTHRFMPMLLHHPRILLLSCSIDYQRTLTKMTWLESQIMQEEEYLSNCVSKLLCLRPKLIFVGGGVSHTAQMFLLKAGVTLFCNVKQSVLQRIARITGADILESVDRLVSESVPKGNSQRPATQLGVCQQFQVKQIALPNGAMKFLTLIKKTPQESSSSNASSGDARGLVARNTTTESTVILRGPDLSELKRAKRCLLYAIYLCYNIKLELSYAYNGSIYWLLSRRAAQTDVEGKCQLNALNSATSSGSNNSVITSDSTKLSLTNSMATKDKFNVDSVDLADQLNGRLFNPSPGVRVCLPFLASTEGQHVPLAAYYTYVIEWPFGRKLNDLLKRKLKVMHAELYAMDQERKLYDKVVLMERNVQSNQLCDHPFLTCHLGVTGAASLERCGLMQTKRSSTALRCLAGGTDQLLALTLAKEDEARYVDFKARAFTAITNTESSGVGECLPSVSRLWAGKGNLLSGFWDRFIESRDSAVPPRPNPSNQPTNLMNEMQQARRLERSILDPRSHQFFSFLTTLYTPKSFMWPEPCVPPWIATVEFYGLQDLPIGLFLEKCCFTQQHCRHPHCEVPMIEHVQRFVQTTGSVQLVIRKLNQDPPRPSVSNESTSSVESGKARPDSRILMWLVCPHCRSSSPIVYMSADTWHYSFVKFLDMLINTPAYRGRCALRAPLVAITEPSSNNTTKTDNGTSEVTTVTAVQRLEPTLQLTCAHSTYKAVQHCFAFERKLVVFKFQPVTVYEVVMPPNEIRIYPPSISMVSAFETDTRTRQGLSSVASDPVFGGSGNETSVSGKAKVQGVSQTTNNGTATASLPLSGYLYSEAMDTLEKYYHVYDAVKSHLLTLQQENANSDLSPTLNTLIYLFESDSRKMYMDVRAELLNYLFHPDGKIRASSSLNVPAVSSEKQVVRVQSASSVAQMCVDVKKNRNSTTEEPALSDAIPLFSLSAGIVQRNGCPTLPDGFNPDGSITFQPPVLRVKNPSTLGHSSVAGRDNLTDDWRELVGGLELVDRMNMAQTLVNELKRWIYGFIADWNSRCTDFDSLAKRAEKSAKETRKKVPPSASSGLVSPHALSKAHKSGTPEVGLSANDASSKHGRTISQVSSGSLHGTRGASTLDGESVDSIDLPRSTRSRTVSSENELKGTTSHHLPSLLVADASNSSLVCPPGTTQSERLPVDSNVPTKPTELDNSNCLAPNQLSTNNVTASVVSSIDEVSSQRQSKSDGVEKKQKLPVLDPLHLKAVYQSSESETISSMQSPQNSHKFLLQVPDTTVHTASSAASISLSAPSGMRRFIHTLLPSNNDLKPFEEPFPPNEHPQLSLIDDISTTPFKRTRDVSFSVHQAEISGVTARSPEYLQNLVQHLRFSSPDIYVNDRELTSIIAYALSTHEYERHLVDLHSVVTAQSSAHSSVQIGQSALSELAPTPKESSGQPSPASSMVTMRNQKQRQVNFDGDSGNSVSARNSMASTRSVEHPLFDSVSAKSFTSSTTSATHMNHTIKSPANPSNSSSAQNQTVFTQVVNGVTAPVVAGAERTGSGNNRHIKIQFSDSSTQFFCCVYYASEFFRLRQLLLPQGDVGFIRSLARCYQWDARGGKSGSLFMKTCDERFVVKELSSIEMKTFHEISQQYFDYLIGAALEQRLCVLSRILGVFHVGFKNSLSGEAHRFDVLVMENLFHDRPKLRFIYDLKGSLRKRLAEEQGAFRGSNEPGDPKDVAGTTIGVSDGTVGFMSGTGMTTENQDQQRSESAGTEVGNGSATDGQSSSQKHVPVLLDQNLLNASVDSPLYLRVHSKNALSHCLQVDTAFLTNLFIMDYSLLVGVDPSTNQLVIGLIDYLRKFTLDKRLEMLIKQTITSAQGPMPTILTPDLYRERFLFQMDSYFPLVPDQWYDSLAEHAEAWRVNTA